MKKLDEVKEYAVVYAKGCIDGICFDKQEKIDVSKCDLIDWAVYDYMSGYTQAEQDLTTQLTACKEALREIIKECEEWVVPGAENSNNCENNHYVEIDDLKSLITKAKTLIE